MVFVHIGTALHRRLGTEQLFKTYAQCKSEYANTIGCILNRREHFIHFPINKALNLAMNRKINWFFLH